MKAFVRSRHGGPEAPDMRDVDTPAVRAGEVLVRVQASSVSTADIDYLRGRDFTKASEGVRPCARRRGQGLIETVPPDPGGGRVLRLRTVGAPGRPARGSLDPEGTSS